MHTALLHCSRPSVVSVRNWLFGDLWVQVILIRHGEKDLAVSRNDLSEMGRQACALQRVHRLARTGRCALVGMPLVRAERGEKGRHGCIALPRCVSLCDKVCTLLCIFKRLRLGFGFTPARTVACTQARTRSLLCKHARTHECMGVDRHGTWACLQRADCLVTHFKKSSITHLFAYTDHPSQR